MSRIANSPIELPGGVKVTLDGQSIKVKGDKITEFISDKRNYQADDFVVAAGSWSPVLLKWLKIRLPLQAGKGYSFTIEKPPVTPKLPSILVEARVATTPMLNGFRVAGTMEITGLNHAVNTKRVQGIIDSVKTAMPQLEQFDFEQVRPWAGLRPCTPDGLPYIGRTKALSNLCVGTGHAMLGWTLGPITGKLLTQQILSTPADIKSDLLNVDRYN